MKEDVVIRIVRSDDKEFMIDNTDWIIPSDGISGIDFPDFNLYSQTVAIGDGSVVTGSSFSSRIINLKFHNSNTLKNSKMRNDVQKFFNARNEFKYKLYIKYQEREHWIESVINKFSCPSENIYKKLTVSVMFFCENPYFRSIDEFNRDIASIVPQWAFPWIDTIDIKPKFSTYNFDRVVNLINEGDVDTAFVAYIRFIDIVENPIIVSGENKLEVSGSYGTDDLLIIDFEKNTVTLNGKNVSNRVTSDSNFVDIKIPVGGGIVGYDAKAGENAMSVTILYNQLYSGM